MTLNNWSAETKIVSLTDFLNKRQYRWEEGTNHKHIFWEDWPFGPGSYLDAQEELKDPDRKSLGTKVIDGHPCHGYENENDQGICQSWIGDDINYLVYWECALPKGTLVMRLKSWSTVIPPADIFRIPPGYTRSTGRPEK